MEERTATLLHALWRGAEWGNYWCKGAGTQWTPTISIADCTLSDTNVYLSVHPAHEKRADDERTRNQDVAALNCLFCEWDLKDWNNDDAKLREHIIALEIQPHVIIASGGGYHGYTFVDEPMPVTSDGFEYLAGTQAAWVRMCNGDPGAHDMARVLRLPGTWNAKYTPKRKVTFARFDLLTRPRYKLVNLCAMAEGFWADEPAPKPATTKPYPSQTTNAPQESMINKFNSRTKIVDILKHYGYTIIGDKFVRPDKKIVDGTSGTIDTSSNTCYTFSSNDPAYLASDVSPSQAGCTLKPFDLLCRITYHGDAKEAVKYLHSLEPKPDTQNRQFQQRRGFSTQDLAQALKEQREQS